ncbi:unnamed protein product [Parascedosporium putredinis]|uniref:Zn(2)-C6 fungal-type domain-containing protein n=1 Tax=Parascedosporium putredinis TaxID=1442378 RepID=A0A9P1H4L0_9PEZI|nr:unnamed protein product [Parascedosporium putredinis]CAI7996715.1 unnamed protein product [Parascedosporium putredinis]
MMQQRPGNRAHIVCVQCHARKVKCDLQDRPDSCCANCRRSNQQCVRRHGVRARRKPPHAIGTTHVPHSPSPTVDAAYQDLGIPHAPQYLSRAKEAILRATQAAELPRPALLAALIDDYFNNVFSATPVVDPQDVAGPNASVLLLQAVCLSGSLVRQDRDGPTASFIFYEKVKTLLYLNYETDVIVNLKAMCLLSCWSSVPTNVVTLDGPWQWLGSAIRLALQIGLHRRSTYEGHPQASCLRRIFWFLANAERMMVACWGRLGSLRVECCDVQALTADDFPHKAIYATTFTRVIPVIEIVGRIAEMTIQKQVVSGEQTLHFIDRLCEWIHDLPDEVRLFDRDETRQPFNRHISELHIYYFVAIILTQMVGKQARQYWKPPLISVIAASALARIYEEIFYREQTQYLPSIHGFLSLVAAIPLIYFKSDSAQAEAERAEELEMIISVINSMKYKFGGCRLVYTKIQGLKQEVKAQAMALVDGAATAAESFDELDFAAIDGGDASAAFNTFFSVMDTLGMDMTAEDMGNGEAFNSIFNLEMG